MKNLALTFLLVFTTVAAIFGQDEKPKFHFMVGGGFSFSGSGDIFAQTIENELNFRIKPSLSSSLEVKMGRGNGFAYQSISFLQANLNLFLTPKSYDSRNCFRFGLGASLMQFSNMDFVYSIIDKDNNQVMIYEFSEKYFPGVNIIIEDDYDITQRYIVGVKGFAQIYGTHRIFTGLTLKLGLRL